MQKTSIGIIGLGYWGPHFVRTCFENDQIELRYCCDKDTKALSRITKKYPSVELVTDYHSILSDSNVDAVIIVTPPVTHYKLIADSIRSGKHVLVEKPITVSSKEADHLIRLEKKYNKRIMVDHIFLFNSGIQKLQELIKKRSLGKILYITGTYTALGPVRYDINALWDLAPHFFYLIPHILGKKPSWVSVTGGSYLKKKTEDAVFITLGFSDSVLVNLQVSWLYPYKVRSLVVVGRRKMAVFDDVSSDQKLKIYDKGAYYDVSNPAFPSLLRVTYREGDVVIPKIETKEPLSEVVDSFIQSIKSGGSIKAGALSGRDVIVLLEAAERSMRKKGKRIYLS